jgi:hypothetical protein
MFSSCFRASTISALMAATTLLIGSPDAKANLLINPSFEAVDASASPYFIRSFSSTPGWTQFLDGVDLINNNFTQPPLVPVLVSGASDGVNYLDMNQLNLLGGIYQVVSATIGDQYLLTLDSAAWATNSIGGTLGYELYDPLTSNLLNSGTFTDNVGGVWNQRSLLATATSSSIGVRIQGLVATQAGMGLDNVSLTLQGPLNVPVPGPLTLLGVTAAFSWSRCLRSRLRRSTPTV